MKLVIVSGASGSLGAAYLKEYQGHPDTSCVALTRREISAQERVHICLVDLLDRAAVAHILEGIPLKDASEILFIHPVGKFKFEEHGIPAVDVNGDGIDDEVYASNIDTFENVADPLLENVIRTGMSIPITLCAFGSISDKYVIKYWQSYSKAKQLLRERMQALAERTDVHVRSVFFEVSTADTDKERELRPFADTKYWLSTEEVVSHSLPILEHPEAWNEISIYKPMPTFNPTYYEDLDKVRGKWSREMGRELP